MVYVLSVDIYQNSLIEQQQTGTFSFQETRSAV